jgi:hypothetical protein
MLPLAIFFFRFLEWWYNSGYGKSQARARGRLVQPPRLPKVSRGLRMQKARKVTTVLFARLEVKLTAPLPPWPSIRQH